ncbi:MAG: hypothetical protein KH304_20420 [Clostridium sp.]|uniref:hypothetical protein n=1 Tax=Clostridia TaxID=186801 RepID=UPI0011DDF071|nr:MULTISPECIES: hypothetical protein [Clostridia]MBS6765921.1 hypothetical protein [Clostridium sp.]
MMLEITEIEISNNPVMTNERFQIRVTIKETTDYPYEYPRGFVSRYRPAGNHQYDYPYDYPYDCGST